MFQKIVAIVLALQLLIVPAVYANEMGNDMSQPEKSISTNVMYGNMLKQSINDEGASWKTKHKDIKLSKHEKEVSGEVGMQPKKGDETSNQLAHNLKERMESPKFKTYTDGTYYYEEEPNDSFDNADPISLSTMVVGSIDDNSNQYAFDHDYYQLKVDKSGMLQLAGMSESDQYSDGLIFDLYDQYGNYIATSQNYVDDDGVLFQYFGVDVNPGYYYVVAWSAYSDNYYVEDNYAFDMELDDNSSISDLYAVISNESTDSSSIEPTGTFDLKSMKYSMNKDLKQSTYRLDVNKPFDGSDKKGKLVQGKNTFTQIYSIGDTKYFWVTNLVNNSDYQINAKLAYSGSKVEVWVNNNQISDADAQKLGEEFDNRIYSSVTNNFGQESDVDHDPKIKILCYDIQDGFSGSGAYVGGYFWARDLYNVPGSNQTEMFYIDTYPAMSSSYSQNVESVYGTLAHEFQHMVNYNRNVLVEGTNPMDTWMDEGFAMAAEEIYLGHGLSDRVDYYNASSSIQNGHSLLYWDDDGDVLANYSLSYLFMQYIKNQANQGDSVFKEILQDPNNDFKSIEDISKKYIDSDMTFGKLMTDFRIALLLNKPTGVYGFNGDPFFTTVEKRVFTGSSVNLRGGGSVATTLSSDEVPSNKGEDITYTFFDLGENGDNIPPENPIVNDVSDADTQITGTAEANGTVYAEVGQTEIGRAVANDTGEFTLSISPQSAGTVIDVYALDAAGNVSPATKVTVVDETAPAAPTVNTITSLDTSITGTAEADSTIIAKVMDKEIGHSTADKNGKFTIIIAKQSVGSTIELVAVDKAGNTSTVVRVKVSNQEPQPLKLIGSSRYTTAVKVSETGWETSNTVFLVNGGAIADGLTATPLASAMDAPILLTKKDELPSETLDEIQRLKAKNVILIGGKAVISDKVEKILKARGGISYSRIGGSSRYDTSLFIAKQLDKIIDVKTIYMAFGKGEPDALSIAAQSGLTKQPIILTDKKTVPSDTYKWLENENLETAYFIGGKTVIEQGIINAINNITSKDVLQNRLSGSDRHMTNAKVIETFYKQTDVLQTILVANSQTEKLVDALSAGPLAAKFKVPVLLVSNKGLHASQISALKDLQSRNVYQIGGGIESAVLDQVVELMN